MSTPETVWPKQVPVLTPEQERIRDDFMEHWHTVLPGSYSLIERFNHGYPAKRGRLAGRTLEIGSGLGEHLEFEARANDVNYTAVELREEMAQTIEARYPDVTTLVADCQQRLPFADATFDRVLAIHVLEHLPDLPAALREVHRILAPDGHFLVVIPCEGGRAYGLARRLSAQRIFERRYGTSYQWCIRSEHLNVPGEILHELEARFTVEHRQFFPLRVPSTNANLVIGLTLRPR